MMSFMVVLTVVFFILLLLVTGVKPRRSSLNHFQRQQSRSKVALLDIRREKLLSDVISLQRVLSALLLVIVVTMLVGAFGWVLGCVLAVVVAVEYGAISRIRFIQKYTQSLYDRHETTVLDLVESSQKALVLIRVPLPDLDVSSTVGSRDELLDLIKKLRSTVVSADDKALILNGLNFSSRLISEVMVSRNSIKTVNKDELLGPLVLDDLHRTGYSQFPVVDGSISSVVGILDVGNLLSLDVKKSTTAEREMSIPVLYIHQGQSLSDGLAVFASNPVNLLIVVDSKSSVVGLVSLSDIIEALMGSRIGDRHDSHDSRKLVSERL